MKFRKPYSEHSHSKKPPWEYMETIEKLLQVPDYYWKNFFITSYITGGRQGEIIQLKNKDVSIKNNVMDIRLPTEKKRDKAFAFRIQIINPAFSFVEKTGFETIQSILEPNKPEKFLFKREDITEKSNLRYARRFSTKYLGINHHFLRHCRLTHCVTIFNFNEFKLMQYAGWTHPEYCTWYVRLNLNDMRRAMGVE